MSLQESTRRQDMQRTRNQLTLLLLLPTFILALSDNNVKNHVRQTRETCGDDPELIDEEYKADAWPHFHETVKCNKERTESDIESMHLVPHPCAILIYIGIKFVDLQEINIAENIVSMKIIYTEQWQESRFNLPNTMNPKCNSGKVTQTILNLEPIHFYRSKIWTPDFYIKGALGFRTVNLIKTFDALRVNVNKTIENVATMNVVLMCPMNFEYYPFDTQTCNVTIESFGLFHKFIGIMWHPSKVQVLPAFKIEGYEVVAKAQDPASVMYADEVFPQLRVSLTFRRIRFKYILMIYAPSILHFVIAWLAFFLPKEVSQGRCIINCTTTLSLVAMLSVFTRNSPHGGYVKALDTWCYFSVFFQFLCTLDAMIDTRLLYAATNMKRNPTEAGTRHILALVIDPSNWLGQEVRLVHTRDEGKSFDETVRDLRRLQRENRRSITPGSDSGEVVQAGAAASHARYRFSARYYRFLKIMVMYQEWSQYICLAWYLLFLLGYLVLYVP